MQRPQLRYGLAGLMFVLSCVAGYFAGYRYGGAAKDREIANSAVTVVNYDVADLVDGSRTAETGAQLEEIRTLIVETIEPDTWRQGDGFGVEPFAHSVSIVVRQTGSRHAAIRDMLQQLRELKAGR